MCFITKHNKSWCTQYTCMCPGMSLQLITTCEAFPTEYPAADKGPFSRVQPHMRPQQRRLPEGLLTTRYVTYMLPLPYLTWPAATKTNNH